MHLLIFYPGGVSYGALPDDASNEEIYDVMKTAATVEEGNGNGRVSYRKKEGTYETRTNR